MPKPKSPGPAAIALKRLRDSTGASVREFAKDVGKQPTSYQHYEDDYKAAVFRADLGLRFVEALVKRGVDRAAAETQLLGFTTAKTKAQIDLPPNVQPGYLDVPARSEMPDDIEVRGTAVGGSRGDFRLNGSTVDHVRRPPGIRDAKAVFAIFVSGDSMSPRFEAGDLAFVHKTQPPKPGDDVVVELHPLEDGEPGDAYLKRLIRRSQSRTTLGQFNPPRDDIVIPQAEIKQVFRVLRTAELLGSG